MQAEFAPRVSLARVSQRASVGCVRVFATLVAATTMLLAATALAHEPLADLPARIRAGERVRPEVAEGLAAGDASGRGSVSVTAFGRDLHLDLVASRILAPGARSERVTDEGLATAVAGARPYLYRGRVRGEADSAVAVSIMSGALDGLVRIGGEIYVFEPARRHDPAADASDTLAYPLSDLAAELLGPGTAGDRFLAPAVPLAGGADRQLDGPFPAVLDVAVVADHEFFLEHGANATTQMLNVMGMVDTIYVDQLNVTLRVSHSMVFETANDPFSVFNSGNLFADFRDTASEFGIWRDATGGPVEAAGIGHLFSDKFGINAGFAFIDELCDASRGVGVSTNTSNSLAIHTLIVAHEIGHNFGARHDDEAGHSCSGSPAGFIMASAATGNEFSPCSKGVMTTRGEAAACITEGTMPTTTTSTTTTTTLPVPCAQPVTAGPMPTPSDCLFILRVAVNLAVCDPKCQCAPSGSLPVKPTDALLCLKKAVSQPVVLNCPC